MRVLIWIPTYDGKIDWRVTLSLLQEQYWKDIEVDYLISPYGAVHHSRNYICEHFLAWSWDKLLFIDADNPPKFWHIRKLIQSSKWRDIVSGLVPNRHQWDTYCIYAKEDNGDDLVGERTPIYVEDDCKDIFEIDSCGTWFVIIDRQVIKELSDEYGGVIFESHTRRQSHKTKEIVDVDRNKDVPEMDMQEFSEDILFCYRARFFWYKVYANPNCRAAHLAVPRYIE